MGKNVATKRLVLTGKGLCWMMVSWNRQTAQKLDEQLGVTCTPWLHITQNMPPTEQQNAQNWLASFVQLYPCSHCAEHFVGVCETMPPQVATREQYSMWRCRAHNRVS